MTSIMSRLHITSLKFPWGVLLIDTLISRKSLKIKYKNLKKNKTFFHDIYA